MSSESLDIKRLGDVEEFRPKETPAEKGIFVMDACEVIHSVPLVVIASTEALWSQIEEGAPEPLRTPLETEHLQVILQYHSACVCRNVRTLEESDCIRKKLEYQFETSEGAKLEEFQKAAQIIGSQAFSAFLDYVTEMCDLSSLLKTEEAIRSEAFKRGAAYMHNTTPIYETLRPLTAEDEEKVRALRVGNVTWVGMCTQKEEPDLTFSWMSEKKDEGPAQLQVLWF